MLRPRQPKTAGVCACLAAHLEHFGTRAKPSLSPGSGNAVKPPPSYEESGASGAAASVLGGAVGALTVDVLLKQSPQNPCPSLRSGPCGPKATANEPPKAKLCQAMSPQKS